VASNWQAFSHRHLAAIEANTTGNCPPAIFIPHGTEDEKENSANIGSVGDEEEKDGGVERLHIENKKADNKKNGGENDDDEDDDDDEFSKLGLVRESQGLQAGVVLAAKSYPDVWGVLTSPCPKYPQISSQHASLPTTLSTAAASTHQPKEKDEEARKKKQQSKKEQQAEQHKVASLALQVKREEKAARDRLLQKMHSRWTGDKEGDVTAASRVKKYVQQSQQEEKQILDEYLQAMDDW